MEYILKDNRTGKDDQVLTKLSVTKDNNRLVFSFEAYGSSLNSFSSIDNDTLWKGDVVEVFLDIGEKDSYLEIEVAPNGARFVANIINREIHFIDSSFIKTKSVIKDDAYFVDIDIDLNKFNITAPLMFNAYRIETLGIRSDYLLLAVNPTLSNSFHVRDSFIKV